MFNRIATHLLSSKAFLRHIFPAVLFIFLVILSLLRISGTSISRFNYSFYGTDYHDPNMLYGHARAIRTDEWLVLTPWTLSQAQADFALENPLFLPGQNLTLSDAPAASWTTLFEPHNWAFFFLPLEEAFAFRWWFKAFLLIIAFYYLSILLIGDQYFVSALAALSFGWAPFIQWWYSSVVTEVTSYGILTFLFFIAILNSTRWKPRLFNGLFFTFFATCFALTLYPPFQFPIALFLSLAGVGYLLSRVQQYCTANIRNAGMMIALGIFILTIIIGSYYLTNQSAIQATLNTAYPGARKSSGAEPDFLIKGLAGFFNIQLQNDEVSGGFFENQSEASSFFFLSFFLVPLYVFHTIRAIRQHQPVDYLMILSNICLVLFLLWGVTGLPGILARVLLLDFVPPKRILLALGLINHVLIVYYLAKLRIPKTAAYKGFTAIYSLVVFGTILWLGMIIHQRWPNYLGARPQLIIFMLAFIVAMMIYLLLMQRRRTFVSILLVFTIGSTIYINPLYRGLSPLRNESLLNAIREVNDPRAVWLTYDSNYYANYLAANGVRVMNGTYYAPDLEFWSQFDQTGQYADIYNRYAHILALSASDPEKVEFDLFQVDMVIVRISPCNKQLAAAGVNYFIFEESHTEFACIQPINTLQFPQRTLYLYARSGIE